MLLLLLSSLSANPNVGFSLRLVSLASAALVGVGSMVRRVGRKPVLFTKMVQR